MFRRLSILTCIIVSCVTAGLHAGSVPAIPPSTGFRLANGMKIISVTPSAKSLQAAPDIRIAAETPSLPRPPMAGFSPLVAIVTSDRRSSDDFDWEHALASSYVGKPLNPPAEQNFVVGVLDTGSVVDLVAGDSAQILGLKGSNLTTSEFPIGGVSGTMDTIITKPIGVFAAGLAAIKADGQLDLSKLVGHTNVAALASPPIGCDNGEDVSALVGTPLLAFYTTIINVNQPRRVVVRGKTYIGPDIQITDSYTPSHLRVPPQDLDGTRRHVARGHGQLLRVPRSLRLGEHPGRVAPLDANPAVDGRRRPPHGRLVLRGRGRAPGPGRAHEYVADAPGCSSIPAPKARSSARTSRPS